MAKVIAPGAIQALKEALSSIYWYKRDLRTFLGACLDDDALLARLNWDDYKRNIIGALVDHLTGNQHRYRDALITRTASDTSLRALPDNLAAIDHVARTADTDQLTECIHAIAAAERMLDRNVTPQLACERLAVALTGGLPA